MTFISPDVINKLKQSSNLEDVIADFVQLNPKSLGRCNNCGSDKKLNYSKSKNLFKCFKCGAGGSDAVAYLMNVEQMPFQDACEYLADKYGVALHEEAKIEQTDDFFKAQLSGSGITADSIELEISEGHKIVRYQEASIRDGQIVAGDDMILHYYDLEWKPMRFTDNSKKQRHFYRIRYRNPNLHKAKNGSVAKYRSPAKGGNHLWLPNHLIQAYTAKTEIDTLVICEGEKKADCLCGSGVYAAGIAGIHNFSTTGDMPRIFEQLIRTCKVRNVIFLLDADWNDLNIKTGKSVDLRPRSFSSAVRRFKDYFYSFNSEGHDIEIFFGYHSDKVYKGIDDLIVRDNYDPMDILKAVNHIQHRVKKITLHKISGHTENKIKQYWHLHTPHAFLEHYKKDLAKIKGDFLHGKIKKRINEAGDVELAQSILPLEQFWKDDSYTNKQGRLIKRTIYDFQSARQFLRNRGFGKYELSGQDTRYVHIVDNVVTEIDDTQKIRDFMNDTLEDLGEFAALEMLLRQGRSILSEMALKNLYPSQFELIEPCKDAQYLFFKNGFWEITADHVITKPLSALHGSIWKNQVIDFEPKYEKPIVEFDLTDGQWNISAPDAMNSDIFRFFLNTSDPFWKKRFVLVDGKYVQKKRPEAHTEIEEQAVMKHLVSKILAAGYVLHEYRDLSNMKAIIAMDLKESEVGKSHGGTGKSIWVTMFEYLLPTYVIDAKSADLKRDTFLYDGVDERTRVIVLDDCRVNIDFEFFFSQITRGMTINPKGEKKFTIPSPKFLFSTNHAINGSDTSTLRRQYVIAFSDYYNIHRTPKEDFGRLLFVEWDYDQWNLFYNLMACCIQTYLKYGLSHILPPGDIDRRRLRQEVGEEMMEWAVLMYGMPTDEPVTYWVNKKIDRTYAYEHFASQYKSTARFIKPRYFKAKLQAYAKYAGYTFNPNAGKDGRIRSGSQEFFVMANDDCPAEPELFNEDAYTDYMSKTDPLKNGYSDDLF